VPATILRLPEDDDELWEFVATLWGFEIPRVNVCPNHSAPFDAFADAYFARSPVAVWKASRGLGGKSTMLGTLSITEAVSFGCHISVLGGSAAQSQRVHDVTKESWYSPYAPKELLASDPTQFYTRLTNHAEIKALLASQTSVRGPHPLRLRLDEIDEMELAILEAAQGQPMDITKRNPITGKHETVYAAQTVMSSTHQYPDRTMTAMLKRARQNGWPVFEWCYKESMGTDQCPGWLTEAQIIRKKSEISKAMWDIEFDLQEPSFEGRAIDVDKLEWTFDAALGEVAGENNRNYIFEAPESGARYITGVDWAKEQDWTIIATFRTDVAPWRCVAWRRSGKMPWPVMVGHLEDRLGQYGGYCVHDSTGLGNVINDLITYDTAEIDPFVMVGARRTEAFNEYISGIETGEIKYPRIEYAYDEHKYTTLDDLYGRGHPPDSLVAGALAWSARNKVRAPVCISPVSVTRESSPWRS
jgi:hypothetical protein